MSRRVQVVDVTAKALSPPTELVQPRQPATYVGAPVSRTAMFEETCARTVEEREKRRIISRIMRTMPTDEDVDKGMVFWDRQIRTVANGSPATGSDSPTTT